MNTTSLDLLLKEIKDPHVQENFYRLKLFLEQIPLGGDVTIINPPPPPPPPPPPALDDFLSGVDLIPLSTTRTIPIHRQSINFTTLTIDGTLIIEGDLWLV